MGIVSPPVLCFGTIFKLQPYRLSSLIRHLLIEIWLRLALWLHTWMQMEVFVQSIDTARARHYLSVRPRTALKTQIETADAWWRSHQPTTSKWELLQRQERSAMQQLTWRNDAVETCGDDILFVPLGTMLVQWRFSHRQVMSARASKMIDKKR